MSDFRALTSVCPCHADERRDPRFAELDALIAAGWGSTPLYLIEMAIDRNEGVLPRESGYRFPDDFDAR
ncbi:MAG TPA: hypothetical protein VES20_24495 [Bryobacteraceae bacterium]|nr:hypothetical protein [Bryobacteraceae bacterium]